MPDSKNVLITAGNGLFESEFVREFSKTMKKVALKDSFSEDTESIKVLVAINTKSY